MDRGYWLPSKMKLVSNKRCENLYVFQQDSAMFVIFHTCLHFKSCLTSHLVLSSPYLQEKPSDITSKAKESCQHHQTSMQRSFLVFVVEFITNISPTSQHHQAWKRYLHKSCRGLSGCLTTIENCSNSNWGIYPCLSQLGLLHTIECVAGTIIVIIVDRQT